MYAANVEIYTHPSLVKSGGWCDDKVQHVHVKTMRGNMGCRKALPVGKSGAPAQKPCLQGRSPQRGLSGWVWGVRGGPCWERRSAL